MTTLNEKRVLTTIHLTDTQKKILALIDQAPSDAAAGMAVSTDRQVAANRDTLVDLGLITYSDGRATITDKGREIMSDENVSGADVETPGEEAPAEPSAFESLSLLKSLDVDRKTIQQINELEQNR
jgi:hypothetical protein